MQNSLRLSGNPRFLFEITLVKLAQIKRLVPLEELAENLKKNSESPSYTISRPVFERPVAPANRPASPTAHETAPAPRSQSSGPADALQGDFVAALISQIETQNPRLAAALENAHITRSDSRINFYVPEGYFKMMKLDARDQLDLQTMLQQKLGRPIEVEIHKGEPPAEKQAVKVSTPETLVESDPVVQEFVKMFKGKITKIDFNKERYL
jgi:hypothetical protein